MSANFVVRFAVLAFAALWVWQIGTGTAFACNRTAGCAMDVMQESHDMMQSGAMRDAMAAGQANIDAFRAMNNPSATKLSPGTKKTRRTK